MLTSGRKQKLNLALGRFIKAALPALAFSLPLFSIAQTNTTTPTVINITDTPKMTSVKRLGVNLGTQDFYDSGQMMRNLTFRNPGFEGETWQSILHCKAVTSTSCTDDNQYAVWAANFFLGATAEVIVGTAAGPTATVTSSTAANAGALNGVTINFSSGAIAPHVGDYVEVRKSIPGNGQAGWWTSISSGATITSETTDLSPNTPGKQALKLTAPAGQQATVTGYFDSTANRSFVQLNGSYTLSFRAKGDGGANQIAVNLVRIGSGGAANTVFFSKTVSLTSSWEDYTYTFEASDSGKAGTASLAFQATGSTVLLDDVALSAAAASNNPTVYRNEVVNTLRALNPGVLRYMDSGNNWGSSIDNMLAPDFARERTGYSPWSSEMDDIPLSLPDFLVLCQTIGAEPWYTMQTGMSTQEMSNLMDYLGGSTSTVYGAKRAAMGQTAPWTSVFPTIHLEFGNEVWNTANPGASISDSVSYGKRANVIFTAAKASASYSSKSFDLVINGWEGVPYWTSQVLAASGNYDTVDAAPYLYYNLNSTASTEAIFGPMFAEPESITSVTTGLMNQNAVAAATAARPAKLAIYETNLSTNAGSATQASVNSAVPSVGAGLSSTVSMLLMMRDLGVNTQNLFSLTGLQTGFHGTSSSSASISPLWGAVVDMGGLTNLQRPVFLSEKLANIAILPTLLSTSQTGTNPTWNQAYTTNDDFSFSGAHYVQSFAFTDGNKLNIILFNLSRTSALPVSFAGLNAPTGAATVSTLTAAAITASNESASNVAITTRSATLSAGSSLSLPPFSMTVVSAAAPVIPVEVTGVTVACSNASLSPLQTTTCSASVAGQGPFKTTVTWSASAGSIASDGAYTAPSTVPSAGKAVITATSVQDTSKSASFTLPIAANTVTGVTAKCGVSSLGQAGSTTCTASVTGTGGFSSGVVWTASAGVIDAAGNLVAPEIGTSVTVKATSTQDATKSGTVTVTLYPVLVIGTPISTTTANSATVGWQLNSVAHSGVSWGTTTSVGNTTPYDGRLITAPSYTLTGLKSSTTYYMVLFSYNGAASASKTYKVATPPPSTVSSVGIACGSTTLSVSGSTSCKATVAGSGSFSSAVAWTASAGTIDAAGNFTAPTTGSTVTVQATSTQDKTKFAIATIQLSTVTTPPAAPTSGIKSVTVNCALTDRVIAAGASTTCKATVVGTGSFSSAVTWSTTAGTIDAHGNLVAPQTGSSFTVRAVSSQDRTKTGAVTIPISGVSAKLAITNPVATVTSTSAVIGWTTNIAAHNGVDYGLTASYGSTTPYQGQTVTAPKVTVSGLKPATKYDLLLFSFIGTQTVLQPFTITTAAK